jgi:23S rRNA (adenine2503-C2)-methyltransferase
MHEEMGIPMRHITVSLSGFWRHREIGAEELAVNPRHLASPPDDELRHRLIPTSAKTSVNDIVKVARDYVARTSRRVTFEYVVGRRQ